MTETVAERRFRHLYEAHHRAVLAYLLRRTDRESALEACEDVYLVAWRRLDSVPRGDKELAWLYTTARNVLANRRRRMFRLRRLNEELHANGTLPDDDPASAVLRIDDHRAVRDALGTLSRRDQEVLRLAVWEELPYAEIGEVLGCSANAVAVRVHRALQRVAKAFDRIGHIPIGRTVLLPGEER